MVDSILHMCIATKDCKTSLHHHTRGWIFLRLLFPENTRIPIVSFSIDGECLRITLVCIEVFGVTLSSKKLKDLDSFGLSLCGNSIKFPNEKSRIQGIPRILRDDDIDGIFFPDSLESRCHVHRITEDRVIESFF